MTDRTLILTTDTAQTPRTGIPGRDRNDQADRFSIGRRPFRMELALPRFEGFSVLTCSPDTAGAPSAGRPGSSRPSSPRASRSARARCPAGVRKQPRTLPDDHGDGEQDHLVDQLVFEQRSDQRAAAVHLQFAPGPGLQLADGRHEITGQKGRVLPSRFASVVDATYLGAAFSATPMGWRACPRSFPRSRRTVHRSAGRTGTRRRAGRSR